jgi:glycerol-3-phosphate acyltransferase PlsY
VTLLLSLGSYLVGGVPCGWIVGKLKGVDVRKGGSGNIGAANVARLLGRKWGIAVFLLDLTKGLAPAIVVGNVLAASQNAGAADASTRSLCWLLAGLCAVLGHNYSPYLGFRGGKGVATSFGVALGVYPYLTLPAVAAFGVWAVGFRATRMSSVGSICAGVLFPLFYAAMTWYRGVSLGDHWPFLLFALTTSALLLLRHRENIARILAGTEARVGRTEISDESRLRESA